MGADNQAERVIRHMELRARLRELLRQEQVVPVEKLDALVDSIFAEYKRWLAEGY